MKKDKHILLSITQDDYIKIEAIAKAQDRTVSAVARRLVVALLDDEITKLTDGGCSGFKKLEYK